MRGRPASGARGAPRWGGGGEERRGRPAARLPFPVAPALSCTCSQRASPSGLGLGPAVEFALERPAPEFASGLPCVQVRVRDPQTLAFPPLGARPSSVSRARTPLWRRGRDSCTRAGARGGAPWKHAQGPRRDRGPGVVSAAVARLLAGLTRQKVEEDPRLNAKVVSQ